ncbi:hypothetical protein [Actinomadura nitritigenes]|uniref:hypothetical protein n=1 Tax=Actinomadura nitritigenes TaxID=134602 RepID=UPI003D8D2100
MPTRQRLSPAMCRALADALKARRDGRDPVTARPATVAALTARGLAMPDTDDDAAPPILTRQGVTAAAKLLDPDRPDLQPGDLVVYHGSIEWEHHNEFIVIRKSARGYQLLGAWDGTRLDQARRQSISYTGHQAELPDHLKPED